jgi:hypothetical protein
VSALSFGASSFGNPFRQINKSDGRRSNTPNTPLR